MDTSPFGTGDFGLIMGDSSWQWEGKNFKLSPLWYACNTVLILRHGLLCLTENAEWSTRKGLNVIPCGSPSFWKPQYVSLSPNPMTIFCAGIYLRKMPEIQRTIIFCFSLLLISDNLRNDKWFDRINFPSHWFKKCDYVQDRVGISATFPQKNTWYQLVNPRLLIKSWEIEQISFTWVLPQNTNKCLGCGHNT